MSSKNHQHRRGPLGTLTGPATATRSAFLHTLGEGYLRLGARAGRLLLAVSGGPDSVTLLLGTVELASALHLAPEVACVDHGLRPEAEEEVREVGALATGLGIRCHALRAPVSPGSGVEARAREARYQALEGLRAAGGFRWIATGHTATDQAETLLMRLVRGTSVAGARGIHAERGPVLRPMLGITREQVLDFLRERAADLRVASDPMNRDPRFLRVRVRERVLPALAGAAGGHEVTSHLARFAAFAAEDESLLSGLAEDALRRLELPGPPGALDAAGLSALHPALRRRALSRWLGEQGVDVSAKTLERLEDALRRGRPAEVGRRRHALVAGGLLRLRERSEGGVPEPPRPLVPGAPVAHAASGQLVALGRAPMEGAASVLGLDRAPAGPLELRTRRPGDRVRLGKRRRKLQDALVDLKVPGEWRDRLALVAEPGGDVLWIVGWWPRRAAAVRPEWYLSARALYDR